MLESNVDKIPAATLRGTVTVSSISSLAGEDVTTPTNMDSDVPVNIAAVEISLAEQEQLSASCVGTLVDLQSCLILIFLHLGMISLLDSPLCTLLYVMLYSSFTT